MQSYNVSAGDNILASEYNKLRSDLPPVGSVIFWALSSVPDGWLLCDGSSILVANYGSLFAIIGYTFGGAGANFTLPDMRERFVFGKSGTYAIGSTGAGTVTLASTNLPSHYHSITAEANHTHGIDVTTGAPQTLINVYANTATDGGTYATDSAGTHDHGAFTGSTGSGNAFTILPPYLALHSIIKY